MNIFIRIFYFLQFIFLLEQKLNHSNYFEKELIMENFLHVNDNDFHMYAEFGGLYFHAFL
jgi:hypothetical protein